jgi:hypothetical protein
MVPRSLSAFFVFLRRRVPVYLKQSFLLQRFSQSDPQILLSLESSDPVLEQYPESNGVLFLVICSRY